MPVDTRVQEALQLSALALPPKPHVLAIQAEDYVDWTGDEALRIWVTIDENTTDEELSNGRAIIQLKRVIHDSLLAKGINLFPYISLAKPSELLEIDEEE